MPKFYLIDEETLRDFLTAEHTVALLDKVAHDYSSIDPDAYDEYIAEAMAKLPWNEYKTAEDLLAEVKEEHYGIYSLARDQIEAFWEPHEERCGKECQFKFKPADKGE